MISRSREKGAQDDDRKRKISAPAKSGKTQEEVIDDEVGYGILAPTLWSMARVL